MTRRTVRAPADADAPAPSPKTPRALTGLQELVLEMVADEHQTVTAIEGEVRLLLGNGVSRQQMTDAFDELRALRLVEAYLQRESGVGFERYRRAKLKAAAEIWWHATDEGRRENALRA